MNSLAYKLKPSGFRLIDEIRSKLPDEGQLLHDLRSGQPDAFRQLGDLFQEKVLNTCYRFVNDAEDAAGKSTGGNYVE